VIRGYEEYLPNYHSAIFNRPPASIKFALKHYAIPETLYHNASSSMQIKRHKIKLELRAGTWHSFSS
jgi:hypothetical protein